MRDTAVVILNWNGRDLLEKFLPSVIEFTSNQYADIIVADNGSTDHSVSYLKEFYPSVRIIEFDSNAGFAEGYNMALKQIEHPYAVLLNSDVEVTDGWLEPLISYLRDHPSAAACQPKIKSYNRNSAFEYAGAAGGFLDSYGFPYCRGRIFNTVEQDIGQYNEPIEVFWASGACLAVKVADYFACGGLDNHFFAHMEEIDLCWRMKLSGKQIVCLPESTVYHLGGATLSTSNPMKTYLNFRNNLLMLYKNLPADIRMSIIFKRKLFDMIAGVKFLSSFDFKNLKAIFLAHKDYKTMLKHYDSLKPPNKNLLNDLSHSKSIVFDYYLMRKHFFSQLKKINDSL